MRIDDILSIFQEHELILDTKSIDSEAEVSGQICVDDRKIKSGDVFVCIKGIQYDGHDSISKVIDVQPALIISEMELDIEYPSIQVSCSRKAAALLAKLYFKDPSTNFRLIGITGTNGKTTSTTILFKALRELGFSVGMIGTLGYDINDSHFNTLNTTPDILELNQIFADMAKEKVQYVVMEVSSHALALDRVYGINFDYCLFSNLSREHLDFHKSMDEYGDAKRILFEGSIAHKSVALINIDDAFGKALYHDLKTKNAYVFTVGSDTADYMIRKDIHPEPARRDQNRFSLQGNSGIINIRSYLPGSFNTANLALCAATLSVMGFEKRQIEQGVNAVQSVRGRFERIPNDREIGVFVDYAHSPDALEKVLRTAREITNRRVLCLFGAGGERDSGKRPLMLKSALHNADAVIICDDNPRKENPNSIIFDIVRDTELWLPWWIIRDRREAIFSILRLAQPGDIVLICGKGHETYQEIGQTRHHFDDADVAREFFREDIQTPHPDTKLTLPIDSNMLDLLINPEPQKHTAGLEAIHYFFASTDSRTIAPHSVYFALKGERYDGNDYLEEVLDSGYHGAVGNRDIISSKGYYQTTNPEEILGKLHRKYLLMFDVYKIALTGSTGKSTTKEMIAQVFSSRYDVLKTDANENNIIGLCKTISRIKPEHRIAVFELGTNAFGEIATLSDICAPHTGIILNIGPSHLEYFQSEEGVFKEKTALFDRPLELRLFDADDPRFNIFSEIGMGVGISEQAEFQITDQLIGKYASSFRLQGAIYSIPYTAPHHIKNAAFAISVGLFKGLSQSEICSAISSPIDLKMRLQLVHTKHHTLIVDCYNANPVSMQSAIEYWLSIEPNRKHIAILGDMLELGHATAQYHSMIAAILAENGIESLISVGHHSAGYHQQDSALIGNHFLTVENLVNSDVLNNIPIGSVILIKGSHSIHLEKLISFFDTE